MKGYAETDIFGSWEMERLDHATRLIAWIQPDSRHEPVRCHELTRAVAHILRRDLTDGVDIIVDDGQYGMVDHSWMWLKPPSRCGLVTSILDVYAVARLPQVQLVSFQVLGTRKVNDVSYRSGPERTDIDEKVVNHLVYHMMGFEEWT